MTAQSHISGRYFDQVIIGGGIIGLSIARELLTRRPGSTVLILDKEERLGSHASGRNSGVLHSGIYYPKHSMKAKVCAAGAKAMMNYCKCNGLPVVPTGKVIVPINDGDDVQLDLLYARAKSNEVNIELLDQHQLKELEPEVRSVSGRALYSPDTSVVDPNAVLCHLASELREQGVEIRLNCEVAHIDPDISRLFAGGMCFQYGTLYNASGLSVDRVAHKFGVGRRYCMLPFKGIYYRLMEDSGIVLNRLVYPVPDIKVPFLGVHSVRNLSGETYFGPTAVPAFGRENYQGLAGIDPAEAMRISYHLITQYLINKQGFKAFAHAEAGRFIKRNFVEAARALVPRLRPRHLRISNKVGIRAQLVDRENHELVMDFLIERKDNSVHVLNAVSPGFTSAFELAKMIVQ